MYAIRTAHNFLQNSAISGDNLGLLLDKLNSEIDTLSNHDAKDNMLQIMSAFSMNSSLMESYEYAFRQWSKILKKKDDCEFFDISSISKSLIGTGNASVHEFGVNLNKPWGVPYISGSTLKGLVSSYLFKNGGKQWWKSDKDNTKSDFQVELFGGSRKDKDDDNSYCGSIVFNDAWIYPVNNQKWFVNDIINVHYQKYYGEIRLPDGTEDPIPVKIAALQSQLKFFVTIQGEEKERKFIKSILVKALTEDGIGGKTSVGYGRFEVLKSNEEKNQKFIKSIAIADNEELLKLNKEAGKIKSLFNAFKKAVDAKPLSRDLLPLYRKYNPLKIILLEKNGIKSYDFLRKVYKDKISNAVFTKYLENSKQVKLSKTDEAQEIFDFAFGFSDFPVDQINKNILLKNIVYGWNDLVINDDTIDEIINSRSQRKWLSVVDLKEAIINSADLSEDAKEIALLDL